jgi:gas vesicle protein
MADWTGGATGALSGASVGSAFGPIGAVAGGVIGGAAGLFGGPKKKKKNKKISSLDKSQKRLNDQQHQSILGQGPLADLYNYDPQQANDVFDKNIANPAYRNFKEKLAPEITGQFRKNGLMNSSYAGDALSKAARDIQENLDSKRSKFQYGAQNEAKTAKRNAVENLQNRQTFAYDKAAGTRSGFDINQVLSSITPEMTDSLANHFKPKAAGAS